MNKITKKQVPHDDVIRIVKSMMVRIGPKAIILNTVIADDLDSGWAACDTTHGVEHNWFTLDDGREVVAIITYKY